MFCKNCGKEIDEKAVVCVHCGCATNNYTSKGKKEKYIAVLLAIFLGGFGVHRFYMNETKPAIIILIANLVCSALWILIIPIIIQFVIWLVELIRIIGRPDADFE